MNDEIAKSLKAGNPVTPLPNNGLSGIYTLAKDPEYIPADAGREGVYFQLVGKKGLFSCTMFKDPE